MPKKKSVQQKSSKHLTLSDRIVIQTGLKQELSIRAIAKELQRSPSTISKEIKKHIQQYAPKANNCVHRDICDKKNACGNKGCKKQCHFCTRCANFCDDYQPIICEQRGIYALNLCNACPRWQYCRLDKARYEAEAAQHSYDKILSESRSGFDLSDIEIAKINEVVTPLIQKGIPPYAIIKKYGAELGISESTLRRLIDACKLDARNIDLLNKVSRKPRKTEKRKMKNEIIALSKIGRTYDDYKQYTYDHDVPTVQMDCVEGIQSDSKVLLTLHFPLLHFQLAFLMERHTAACVVETLDLIELTLGKEMFALYFPLILTDNGHEFTDIEGMERSIYGGTRTKIFFCEPNRSDQKAECETNHKFIRYILPKGTSLDGLVQPQINLMMSHINNLPRKLLLGKTPYEMARQAFAPEFFELVGIDHIPFDELVLKPSLLK